MAQRVDCRGLQVGKQKTRLVTMHVQEARSFALNGVPLFLQHE
jgi:hypothetical protein